MKRSAIGLTALLLLTQPIFADTKMQNFFSQKGVTISNKYRDVGEIKVLKGGSISIRTSELVNVTNNERMYGLSVGITGKDANFDIEYVDFDEIAPLVAAIDYISNFQVIGSSVAKHETSGGLRISTSQEKEKGKRTFEVYGPIKTFREPTAYLTIEDLADFKKLLLKSKKNIESMKL